MENKIIKCPLCAQEFEKGRAACAGCLFHGSCDLIRCPNCGYEFLAESKIVNFFKNVWAGIFRQPAKRRKGK